MCKHTKIVHAVANIKYRGLNNILWIKGECPDGNLATL